MENTEKENSEPMLSKSEELVSILVGIQNMVQSYAYAMLNDFHLAQDVYQEVAAIIARKWEELPKGKELEYWAKETTRRKSLELIRERKKVPCPLEEDLLVVLADDYSTSGCNDDCSDEQMMEMLSRCVKKLTGPMREIIEARFLENPMPSCEDIASRFGRTVQAVYSILKRARLEVLECVEKQKHKMAF